MESKGVNKGINRGVSKNVNELQKKAVNIRKSILCMLENAASGHSGGSLSAADLLVGLYYYKLEHDPKNPDMEDRDRFILSKAHCCPALYAVLADLGYFPKKELAAFRKINSLLQGHTTHNIPGVEMSGGSLGQGLSFANGVAFASKLDKKSYKVYCMLGDGELQEGQIWEAAMTAHHHKFTNLIAIVDKNKIQNDWFVKETKDIDPLPEKWEAFGWNVISIDGHNMTEIVDAYDRAAGMDGPTVIIADTIKGKGVSFMENNPVFHGMAPNAEQLAEALKELDEQLAALGGGGEANE